MQIPFTHILIIAGSIVGALAAFTIIFEAIRAHRAGIAAREAVIRRILEAR
jgi:hypothetical protein